MDLRRLTRLGTESSQTDVECLEFGKALRESSQNILLVKLVQIDLDMNLQHIRQQRAKQDVWQKGRYEEEETICCVSFYFSTGNNFYCLFSMCLRNIHFS